MSLINIKNTPKFTIINHIDSHVMLIIVVPTRRLKEYHAIIILNLMSRVKGFIIVKTKMSDYISGNHGDREFLKNE